MDPKPTLQHGNAPMEFQTEGVGENQDRLPPQQSRTERLYVQSHERFTPQQPRPQYRHADSDEQFPPPRQPARDPESSENVPIQHRRVAQPNVLRSLLGSINTVINLFALIVRTLLTGSIWWSLAPTLGIFISCLILNTQSVSSVMSPIASISCFLLPRSSALSFCPSPPAQTSDSINNFRKGLDFGAQLAEMQKIASGHSELPYTLQMTEGSLSNMIVVLSSSNLPSREKFVPLLNEYRTYSDEAIESLSDSFGIIDTSVDVTLRIVDWVKTEMERIRKNSLLDRVMRAFTAIRLSSQDNTNSVGFPLDKPSKEAELRKLFMSLTDEIQKQLDRALSKLLLAKQNLDGVDRVLFDVAYYAMKDGNEATTGREQLKNAWFWRKLFQSHQDKITNFEEVMETAAAFYRYTTEARRMVNEVQAHIKKLHADIKGFRYILENKRSVIKDGVQSSFDLYLGMLCDSIEKLEEGRLLSRDLKRARMDSARAAGSPRQINAETTRS